jgi:hypothetical protein
MIRHFHSVRKAKGMVKYISIFRLKPGFDPQESYQIWMNEHVPYVKEVMSQELTGYVVGKVVHDMTKGEKFFGSVQLSFQSLDDAKKAWKRMLDNPPDELYKRITDIRRVIIEETDVFS